MVPVSMPIEIVLYPETIQALTVIASQLVAVQERIVASRVKGSEQANHAELRGSGSPALLMNKKETARLLRVSEKTIWSLCQRGDMPQPIRFGSAVRWSADKLKAWIAAGCPKP